MLSSTSGEKQCERGEWEAAVVQVHGEVATAVLCCVTFSSSLPGKELVAKATGVRFWFREAGKCPSLAGVHSCPPMTTDAGLCGGCSAGSCSWQQGREPEGAGMVQAAGKAAMQVLW